MIKQMLKLAGVKSEKEFLKKFPTEQSFLDAYPEASMLLNSANMNYYAEGGEMMMPGPEQQGGGIPPQEQGMPAEQDVAAQQEQIIQFIMQLLQQNVPPPEIIQQLVQAGLPEDQAAQLVNAVMEQMESQMQGPSPEEQMMQQEQPQQPDEQMAEEPVTDQGMMMRKGGTTPCYKCGGKYKKGGSAYSGTYSAGVYYANGGPAFTPDYGMMAMGGLYKYDKGGCPPGEAWDGEFERCMPLPKDYVNNNSDDEDFVLLNNPGGIGVMRGNDPRFRTGFGLMNKGYALNYDVDLNTRNSKDITHMGSLTLPNLFGRNKGINIQGEYTPNQSLDINLGSPQIPLFGGSLGVNANYSRDLTKPEEVNKGIMVEEKRKPSYGINTTYQKKLKSGPTLVLRAGYNQQYGGLTKFVGGGQSADAGMQDQQMGQQEAMVQELMSQIAQMLKQGAKPEEIIPQLVKMGMSQEEAMQIIEMTSKQMQGGGKQPVMPMQIGMYGGSYAAGGVLKEYKKGGEYDLNESEIQDLVNKGYKIQYM